MSASNRNVSKSVGRAFAVLELFAQRRQALSAPKIREALELPQPSAHALLQELVAIGYLRYDPTTRSYFPQPRLRRLGAWLAGAPQLDPNLASMLKRLSLAVGETCSVSHRHGQQLEILHAECADHPVAVRLSAGRGETLWRSAAGRTLLAGMDKAEASEYLANATNKTRRPADRQTLRNLPKLLARIQSNGYYMAADVLLQGVTSICVPARFGDHDCVVTVAAVTDRVAGQRNQILRRIRKNVRDFSAP